MVFKPGQVANPRGRPKGSKNKAVSVRVKDLDATVQARAATMLQGMLRKAYDVIDEALDEGDARVAQWVVDNLIGKNHSMLPEAIDITLATMDDVLTATQMITEMVMQRKLSIDDGLKSLTMLSQYASFRAFERIDELKTAVDEMKRINEAKTINGSATMPSWGRLSEDSPTANKEPAE
jgi:hypothetical protein